MRHGIKAIFERIDVHHVYAHKGGYKYDLQDKHFARAYE